MILLCLQIIRNSDTAIDVGFFIPKIMSRLWKKRQPEGTRSHSAVSKFMISKYAATLLFYALRNWKYFSVRTITKVWEHIKNLYWVKVAKLLFYTLRNWK